MRSVKSLCVRLGASAAVGTMLIGAGLTSAEGVWVLPSKVPLTNSQGVANGCTGKVALIPERAGGIPTQPKSLGIKARLTCDKSAGVHWDSSDSALYEVMPDGSLRTVSAPGLVGRSSYPKALDGTTGSDSYFPCNTIAGKGKHTWLARASLKAKRNATAQPFVAKVSVLKTITC